MSEYTPSGQDPKRKDRNALLIGGALCLLVAWAIWRGPDRTPQHAAPAWPEPQQITIDNSSEVHVFSDWCIGLCAK